ncbi:MAG: ATP-binding protein [Oscillospiraceae bacterium]|nr:ATP-binding protein [Oscillospiraceae bacterium]
MKNIIIAGWSRTGKTTLARKLNEELQYFVVSLDNIVAAFGRAYPQLDIRLNWNYEKTTANIAPFLGHFLGIFSAAHDAADEQNLRTRAIKGNRFVLEGGYFHFDTILSILGMYKIEELKDHFVLIGLVQNNKTVDEFIRDFKKYDTEDDWTYGFSEDALREISEDAVIMNQKMTDTLTKRGFAIYDTSKEREQVFDKIVADIASKRSPL